MLGKCVSLPYNPKEMRYILIIALFCTDFIAYAQDRIDTIYYNKSGQIARNSIFSDYYRIALYPADSLSVKEFKDFYITGELKKEGCFVCIDSLENSNSLFDGNIVSYFKNGEVSEIANYANSKLNGEYLRYLPNGSLEIRAYYINDCLDGIYEQYFENGTHSIMEYADGLPVYDYYLLYDSGGNCLKFRLSDNSQIWESPHVSERFIDYMDGQPWEVYFKNGVTLALSNSTVRDYGKWHQINLIISNNSPEKIELDPQLAISAYSVDIKGKATLLNVLSCDDYMRIVKRQQTWAAIINGIGEGLATAGAGFSTSTTTGFDSRGGYVSYTTTTYNASSASLAHAASQQRISNFCKSLEEDKRIKKLGYLKNNTIYPDETISGYVNIQWLKGCRAVIVVNLYGAEYIYEWDFDRKSAFATESTQYIEPNYLIIPKDDELL